MPFLRRLDLRGDFTRVVGRSLQRPRRQSVTAATSRLSGKPPAWRRSTSLSFGVVAVVVALGVGAAGAAPTVVSTTETEVTVGGLDPDTLYDLQVKKSGTTSWTTLSARTKRITVDFTWTPLNPVPNQAVDFTCTTSGVTCEWDKNLDGVPEATGLTWQTSYRGTGVKKPSARGVTSSGAKSAWLTMELTVVAEEPPPPPASEVRYKKTGEGGAAVYGTGSLEEPCYPNLPDQYGQTFCQWLKVTQYNPRQCGPFKDTNDPFAGSNSIRYDIVEQPGLSRCEIGKHRRFNAYTHDWYHTAFKLEPSWGETNDGGAHVHQLQYMSICAFALALNVDDLNDSGYLVVNAGNDDWNGIDGACHYYSGQPYQPRFYGQRPAGWGGTGPLYVIPPGQLRRGVWHEVKYHVYWTPLNEGVLEAWWRIRGGTWFKTLDIGPVGSGRPREFNFPTMALGDQNVPATTCNPTNEVTVANIEDPCHWPAMDKMGQYLGGTFSDDNVPSMWGQFCRASSREAAETCLG
jgi:hypothetical protein